MTDRLEVWCATPTSSGGWGPITYLAALAGRLFHAPVRHIHRDRPFARMDGVRALLPRRRTPGRSLLLIAAQPGDLLNLADPAVLTGRFHRVGCWIIDSFWDERLPRFARAHLGRHPIDQLWVTDAELVDQYARLTGVTTDWLPWGTDALAAHRALSMIQHRDPRPVDVQRLGRQPLAWDDDEANRLDLEKVGLTYAGRFPLTDDGIADEQTVMRTLRGATVVLASGSQASPSAYRHPTRDYISARFTDAAGAGALIAGSRPRCAATDLIPEAAFVDIDVSSREHGIPAIAEVVAQADVSRSNAVRKNALQHLDWRHRLAKVSDTLGVRNNILDSELNQLAAAAAGLDAGIWPS